MFERLAATSSAAAFLAALLLPGGLSAETEYEQKRTSWGHPDLQGLWSNETITPFERPEELGDRAFLTEEEVAAAEQRTAQRLAAGDEPSAAGADKTAPPKGGSVGAYNLGWMDSGTRIVQTRRTSQVIDPPNGRVPVRPEAQARRQFALDHNTEDYEYMSVWDRCITRGIPGGMLPAGYNNYYKIVQTEDHVMILYEMIHDARIIPLVERPKHDDVRFWNGDPRGWWEGDTLVVETTNFTDKSWIATSGSQRRIKGIPQTEDAHIVERFERVSDDTILWRATITDPEIYTAPWTVELPLVNRGGAKMFEYACHEGNQATGLILRGARTLEQHGESSGD